MALTTVVRGRAYDWSHAIGRGAATGTGFNYIQTMCLGNDGDLYTANRGNENNFGMRVNRIKLGGPGEEELVAEFFQHGEGDGKATWPFGVAVGNDGRVLLSPTNGPTPSRCSIRTASSIRKFGTTGSGDGELLRPAGHRGREERQRHRRRQRQQPAAGVHAGRQAGRPVRQGRIGRRRVQPALGHHDRQGRQHLRRRLEEPPRAEAVAAGQLPDVDRQYGELPRSRRRLRGDLPGTVRLQPAGVHYPKAGLLNHPTDVAVDPDGDIYVTDWGNHRVSASSRPTARR